MAHLLMIESWVGASGNLLPPLYPAYRQVTLRKRFSIDGPNQLLLRDYSWELEGEAPVMEHLKHRLLFPQDLVHYITSCGFRVLKLFDQPAPHVDAFAADQPLVFGHKLQGPHAVGCTSDVTITFGGRQR